jgi:hypothetical protein
LPSLPVVGEDGAAVAQGNNQHGHNDRQSDHTRPRTTLTYYCNAAAAAMASPTVQTAYPANTMASAR